MKYLYLKEIKTNKIFQFQDGESPVEIDKFIPATKEEILAFELANAKEKKLIEIKTEFDKASVLPHESVCPIIENLNLNDPKKVYFYPKKETKSLDDDPLFQLLISAFLNINILQPSFDENKNLVDAFIEPKEANATLQHYALRKLQNYAITKILMSAVYKAKLIQEVEAIKWNISVLTPDISDKIKALVFYKK